MSNDLIPVKKHKRRRRKRSPFAGRDREIARLKNELSKYLPRDVESEFQEIMRREDDKPVEVTVDIAGVVITVRRR